MPYLVERDGNGYRVVNAVTGKVHAKHTSRRRALAQVRLLKSKEKTL